jgi:hypothetical protein
MSGTRSQKVHEVITELMKVRPETTTGQLRSHDVLRHQDVTPAHKYDSILKLVSGSRLIELTARDYFDVKLATFLLDCVEASSLQALGSDKIRVFSAKFPKPWSFECVVVVPPKIAKRFEHESIRLKRITYWVLPSFAFEFRDGESGDGFWHQVKRRDGWNIDVIDWSRSRKTKPIWDRK